MQRLTGDEVEAAIGSLDGWKRVSVGDASGITKGFPQSDFLAGLAFVTRVAVLAEQANHHPDVLLTYPRVSLTLTTHDAGGLTSKDVELAKRIDQL